MFYPRFNDPSRNELRSEEEKKMKYLGHRRTKDILANLTLTGYLEDMRDRKTANNIANKLLWPE